MRSYDEMLAIVIIFWCKLAFLLLQVSLYCAIWIWECCWDVITKKFFLLNLQWLSRLSFDVFDFHFFGYLSESKRRKYLVKIWAREPCLNQGTSKKNLNKNKIFAFLE